MAANPSSYYPEACVFNTEETYWVQRQSVWLYSLLSQGADQRWNKVWQVKMNSQCQNDEVKLLIFLFCLSVVSLLSIAVQWYSVVSTWSFSFILMQRSRDDGVSCLRFACRWQFLCYDLHVLKVDPHHVVQNLKQFWSYINDWNLLSIVGQRLLKNVIYDLWKSDSPEAFYSPLFAVVHYFFDRVYISVLHYTGIIATSRWIQFQLPILLFFDRHPQLVCERVKELNYMCHTKKNMSCLACSMFEPNSDYIWERHVLKLLVDGQVVSPKSSIFSTTYRMA